MAGKSVARHALRSRAALAGVTSVLFVGGVATLAHQDATAKSGGWSTPTTEPTSVPPTTVVLEHVARTIYLDRYGNVLPGPPDAAAAAADPAAAAAAAAPGGTPASSAKAAPRAPGSPPAPTGAPKGTTPPAGSPPPTAPAPVTPPPTAPKVTPVPPPPTVPKCVGSKCP